MLLCVHPMDANEIELVALRARLAAQDAELAARASFFEAREAQLTSERDAAAADRDAAAAERDAAAAERDAAAAREMQMHEQLLRLRLGDGGGAGAGAGAGAAGAGAGAAAAAAAAASTLLLSSAPTLPLRKLSSPSGKKGLRIIDGALCVLVERPVAAAMLGITLPAPSIAAAFRALLDEFPDSRSMGAESEFYALASRYLPAGAKREGDATGNMEATTLFTPRSLLTRSWAFEGKCHPELHVHGDVSATRPFRPAFNGEVKSVSATWLNQAVYYAAMDLVRIFFPASADGTKPGPRRFFRKPPLGFAILAFPHVGYLVALEWIGALFVSPVSAPFFLGSAEHAAAIAALPDVDYDPPEDLDVTLAWHVTNLPAASVDSPACATPPPPPSSPAPRPPPLAVSWSVAGGRFRKLLLATARSPPRQRALHEAYERLSALRADAAASAPSALEPLKGGVRLLYGAHEVLVDMPALAGAREMSDDAVTTSGRVLDAAAAAVAWLASRGVLYVDLRGPNVLVNEAGDAVWLVDYDDCVLAPPVRDYGAFLRALGACGATAEVDFASALARDALPDVAAALVGAFQRLD
jgi:hypothetical protein